MDHIGQISRRRPLAAESKISETEINIITIILGFALAILPDLFAGFRAKFQLA